MATYKHILKKPFGIGLYGSVLKKGYVLLDNSKVEKVLDYYPMILGHGVTDAVPSECVKVVKITTDADRVKKLKAENRELKKKLNEQ